MIDPLAPCRILSPERVDRMNQQLQVMLILAERWADNTMRLLAADVIAILRAAPVQGGEQLEDRPGWDIARDIDPFAASPVHLEPLEGTVRGHRIRVVKR